MVCRGEVIALWRCSREITALARTTKRAIVSRGKQSRENTAGIAERFGIEWERYHRVKFNDLSTSLLITFIADPCQTLIFYTVLILCIFWVHEMFCLVIIM